MGFLSYNRPFEMAETTEAVDLKEFQLLDKDTGSADVQVALLTRRERICSVFIKSRSTMGLSRKMSAPAEMVASRASLPPTLMATTGTF